MFFQVYKNLEDANWHLQLRQASLLSIVSLARELALIIRRLMSSQQPVAKFCQLFVEPCHSRPQLDGKGLRRRWWLFWRLLTNSSSSHM